MNQKIIAVVGPDMCGKTEIAKALSKQLNIPYFKAASEHDTYLKHPDRFIMQLRYADVRVLDLLHQTGYDIIMDRAWPCEFVYSNVMNRETDMSVLGQIDDGMARLGAKVIVCHRTSYRGIVDDIDPTIKEHKLQALDAAYMSFTTWTKCSTLILNVDDENLTRELNDITQWLGD